MNQHKLVILGGGGLGREVAWVAKELGYQVLGFWEHNDDRAGQMNNFIPVLAGEIARALSGEALAVAAIGNPVYRRRAVEEAQDAGFKFASLLHSSVIIDQATLQIGEGCVIFGYTSLTTNITLGAHVIINPGCTIGHDCTLEDFVTITPGVRLAGFTHIAESAYMGTGSMTIEHCKIGANAIVGAGAVVIHDIPPGITAVGVPAKPLDQGR